MSRRASGARRRRLRERIERRAARHRLRRRPTRSTARSRRRRRRSRAASCPKSRGGRGPSRARWAREEERLVGAGEIDAATALAQRRDLAGRPVRWTGSPVEASADLTCCHRPGRMALEEERRTARDVGRRHARAVPRLAACSAGSRRGRRRRARSRRASAGARPGVGPADEKSAMTSGRVLSPAQRRRGDRDRRRGVRRESRSSRSPATSKSFPAATTGTTPAAAALSSARTTMSRLRLHLRLADREVDHVHPVRHRLVDRLRDLGRVAVEAEAARRDGERLVVAEVRLRRDARDDGAAVGRSACRRRLQRCRRREWRDRSRPGRTACSRTSSASRATGTPARRSPSAWCRRCSPSGSRRDTRSRTG